MQTRAFIEAARSFHEIGKPMVADYAGGFSALAAAALGGVGGLCHGMGQKEAFRIGDWRKVGKGGGGSRHGLNLATTTSLKLSSRQRSG